MSIRLHVGIIAGGRAGTKFKRTDDITIEGDIGTLTGEELREAIEEYDDTNCTSVTLNMDEDYDTMAESLRAVGVGAEIDVFGEGVVALSLIDDNDKLELAALRKFNNG